MKRWLPLTIALVVLVAAFGMSGWLTYRLVQTEDLSAQYDAAIQETEAQIEERALEVEAARQEAAEAVVKAAAFCTQVNYLTREAIPTISGEFKRSSKIIKQEVLKQCPGIHRTLLNYDDLFFDLLAAMSWGNCEQDAWGYGLAIDGTITNTTDLTVGVEIPISALSGGTVIGTGFALENSIRPGETRLLSAYAPTSGYRADGCDVGVLRWWPD